MALDTSVGAYEQLYDSASENSDKYYEGYVELKEKSYINTKWTKYWCVLKKKNLYFFKDINTQVKENYKGYFPLEGSVELELETKNNEWHMIRKDKKKIVLRTENQVLKDSWINAFQMAMRGEPASKESYILPGSGPASPKHQFLITGPHVSPPISPNKKSFQDDTGPPTPPTRPQPARKLSTGYPLQPGQAKIFEDHAKTIANEVKLTDADIRLQNQLLTGDQSWHQASMRREAVERVLRNAETGSFIVRDFIDAATSKNKGYVISLKDNVSQIRHHKILRVRDGGFVLHGYEAKTFDTLPNLLLFFIASQRKTINLIPYTGSYEVMDGSANQSSQTSLGRAATVKQKPTPSPTPTKVRSQSMREYRDQYSDDLTESRSQSYRDRRLPPVPSGDKDEENYTNMNGDKYDENYTNMNARPPRTPPAVNGQQDDDSYLEPFDQGRSSNTDGSYVHMHSPRKLERIPSGIQAPLSLGDGSYVNVPSPSYRSYENTEPNTYINTSPMTGPEEPPPKLPPKRSASLREDRPYVNLPGEQKPPRPPLRKAHTIER